MGRLSKFAYICISIFKIDVMYAIEKLVSSSHVDTESKLTLTSAVDFMQDCSYFQIYSVKSIVEEFERRNMAMFVVSRQMDIIGMPLLGEKLTVKTWVWKLNRVFGSRNTVIYDEKRNPRVVSFAMGAFVDLESGNPTQIPDRIVNEILIEEKFNMEYLSRKIEIPDNIPQKLPGIHVLKSHLDNFNHVNNSKYVMMAYEYLPMDFKTKRMRVEYKIPAGYDNIIYPEIYTDHKRHVVSLNDQHGKPFSVVEFTS